MREILLASWVPLAVWAFWDGLWTGTSTVYLSILSYLILYIIYIYNLILSYFILSYLYVCLSIFLYMCRVCVYIHIYIYILDYIGILYSMAEFYQPFLRRHRIFSSVRGSSTNDHFNFADVFVVQDGFCLDHPWIVSILM